MFFEQRLEPGHLAMLAGIIRTVMLSRCFLVAMQRVAQGTRFASPEKCDTLLRSFEESAPHEFFRYLFDYMAQVKTNKLSLFASGMQREETDQWASVFDVFEAMGLGNAGLVGAVESHFIFTCDITRRSCSIARSKSMVTDRR